MRERQGILFGWGGENSKNNKFNNDMLNVFANADLDSDHGSTFC